MSPATGLLADVKPAGPVTVYFGVPSSLTAPVSVMDCAISRPSASVTLRTTSMVSPSCASSIAAWIVA